MRSQTHLRRRSRTKTVLIPLSKPPPSLLLHSFKTNSRLADTRNSVLITGTSLNGIGFYAAQVIAKYAHLVIITGYNSERLKLSRDAIQNEVPGANIRLLTLDLSSLSAVRDAAAEVNAYAEPLHIIIHNAAAALVPLKLTKDGKTERQIATAHIGPFLFTKLILTKILASSSTTYVPRVVTVSSDGHLSASAMNFNLFRNPEAEPKSTLGFTIYSQAKSANILFVKELSKRSGGRINGYSLHPGGTYTEESIETFREMGAIGDDGILKMENYDWKTLPQGAATIVTAAFDPRLNDLPGSFLEDSNIAADDRVAKHCKDPANAEKLWEVTEEVIGEKFEF
ncbi:short-chain dehydrogenase/reductase family protein [Favolaschia claudopus]|uniref:Short-chain dehydrogenase/reductase family protein n=1 Tax=Favolaschia claudopus TaxID=2862362 RepID=A0AAW0AES4_9AGAR